MKPDAPSPAALTREGILDRLRDSYPHLSEQFGVQRIGLFGSFASRTAVETSDVDLVVSFQRPIGLRFVDLIEHLEALLGRKVDVLTPAGLQGIRLPEVARRIEESIIYV
jgi:predicted nucleotidyltransferase